MKLICTQDDKRGLLEDFWRMDEHNRFIYSQKSLIDKYNLRSNEILLKNIKKYGHAYKDEKIFKCFYCENPYKFYHRKDFSEFFSVPNRICFECKISIYEHEVATCYRNNMKYILNFNFIHNSNINNRFDKNYFEILPDLNFLELVYLCIIIKYENPSLMGKLSPKKFPLFLHSEHYMKNKIIDELCNKKILFYSPGAVLEDEISSIIYKFKDLKSHVSTKTVDMLEDIKKYRLKFYHIIYRSERLSFGKIETLILDYINNYRFSVDELAYIADFLKSKRKNELLFLNSTIEFNNFLKLKINNAVDAKFDQLILKYNLREIYGMLNSAVNSTYYKLDFYSDENRRKMKNIFYKNIVLSNKEKKVFEKKMPGNYIESKLIKFIEVKYELDDIWENIPVNEFIKIFFKKLDDLGKIDQS